MRRLGFSLLALLTFIAVQAGSASAATTLELSAEGVPLEVGTPITTSSSGMIIRTSAGNVTCGESTMEGTVTANDSAKAELQFTSAVFRGSVEHHPFSKCESTLALGEPTVRASGFPWLMTLTAKGNGKTHGHKSHPTYALAFPEATCVMEGTKATNSFNLPLGEEAVPLEISLYGLALKLVKGSSAGCPTSGTFEEPGIAVSDPAVTSEVSVKKTKPTKSKK